MANPKKRKTHSATHKSRSHLALKKMVLKKCPKCGQMRQPHMACSFCGTYKGQTILRVKTKTKKNKAVKK